MDLQNSTWANISKSALIYNLKKLKSLTANDTELVPVIKSNAYGHDLLLVASILNRITFINWICVVSLDEAILLRKNGITKKILVLSFFNPGLLNEAVKRNISLTIYSLGAAVALNKIAKKLKKKANIHIKIDTGTSRLGFLANQSSNIIKKISELKNINIEGIYSHLSDAENINQSITNLQNAKFLKLLDQLKKQKIIIKYKHLACSAAIILNKKVHYNMVRTGISIYGQYSIGKILKRSISLKPVLSWHTKIIQVKEIEKNTYVSYNRSFKTNKKTRIALIPIGYWDGYDRKLSNKSFVLIRNKKCKVLGNICMNLTIVDVSDIQKVKTGDIVTLIGQQGRYKITADDLAKICGTINYEILTRINPLIKRIITK